MKQSIFRVATLVVALCTSIIASAQSFVVDGIYYSDLGFNKVEVFNPNGYYSTAPYTGDIVIPASVEYNGNTYSVTSIRYQAFYDCYGLTSVTIPNSVTSIGSDAFYQCSGLTSVTISDLAAWCNISFGSSDANPLCYAHNLYLNGELVKDLIIPNSVTTIGSYAFYNCYGLTAVTIPNSVTTIGSYAFYECFGLTAVHITDLAAWCNISFAQDYANPLLYAHNLYLNGELVKDLIIPNSVTTIESDAFMNCYGLTSVTIPNSVTSIGSNAFSGCYGLTSVTIPNSVTSIGSNAFYNCSTAVVYPQYTTPNSISGLEGVHTIAVPADKLEAYKSAWSQYADKIGAIRSIEVTAMNGNSAIFKTIGDENLANTVDLKVMGTINSYDIMILRNKMPILSNLDLKDARIVATSDGYEYYSGYTTQDDVFPAYAFYNCAATGSLVSIIFPESTKTIGTFAFSGCRKLVNIEFNDALTSIGSYAFNDCDAIRSVVFNDALTSIGSEAFQYCYRLQDIHFGTGLQTIGSYAFYNCYSLTSLRLSDSLKRIENYAFGGCSGLTEVSLPPLLNYVGDNAFDDCNNIQSVSVFVPNPKDPNIQQNSFCATTYTNATLYIPSISYDKYYWDTQWSQFANLGKTTWTYDRYPSSDDTEISENTGSLPDGSSIDVGIKGGVFVELPQNLLEITVERNKNFGGSIINNGGNLRASRLIIKISVDANMWYFLCPPIDIPMSKVSCEGNYTFAYYNGAKRASAGAGGWTTFTGGKLEAGKGYIFQCNKSGTLTFTLENPTFNSSDISTALSAYVSSQVQDASWNLVGNPFPCYYSVKDLDYNSPITVWNANNNTYQAYSPEDDDYNLMPFEAFFVQKPDGVSSINFLADKRTTYQQTQSSGASVKADMNEMADRTRQVVNLQMGNDKMMDNTRIVFNEKADLGYEIERDAAKFISEKADIQLYTLNSGVQYAINERPANDGEVRLGYIATHAGEYTISATRMEAGMMLYDNQTKRSIDLSKSGYTFQTEAGQNDTRFVLTQTADADALQQMAESDGSMSLYDLNGVCVMKAGNKMGNLPAGVYVLKSANKNMKVYLK